MPSDNDIALTSFSEIAGMVSLLTNIIPPLVFFLIYFTFIAYFNRIERQLYP